MAGFVAVLGKLGSLLKGSKGFGNAIKNVGSFVGSGSKDGGSSLKDWLGAGIGALSALSPENNKGGYSPSYNWRGGGLASNSMDYYQNYNYVNPYDLVSVISGSGRNGNRTNTGYNLGNNILSRLSGLGGKIGNVFNRKHNNVGDFYNNLGGMA